MKYTSQIVTKLSYCLEQNECNYDMNKEETYVYLITGLKR